MSIMNLYSAVRRVRKHLYTALCVDYTVVTSKYKFVFMSETVY